MSFGNFLSPDLTLESLKTCLERGTEWTYSFGTNRVNFRITWIPQLM